MWSLLRAFTGHGPVRTVEMGEPTLSSGSTRGKPQRVRVSTETQYISLVSYSPQRVRVSTETEGTNLLPTVFKE